MNTVLNTGAFSVSAASIITRQVSDMLPLKKLIAIYACLEKVPTRKPNYAIVLQF